MMNRQEILSAAKKNICNEERLGCNTSELESIGYLWSVYLRTAYPKLARVLALNGINEKDVAMMMALLKISRIATGSNIDSFIDLAGYSACAGEIANLESNERLISKGV